MTKSLWGKVKFIHLLRYATKPREAYGRLLKLHAIDPHKATKHSTAANLPTTHWAA